MNNKIAIISLPRSGSTYLVEIAQFMQRYEIDYCEPFHSGSDPSMQHQSDYSKFCKKLEKIKNCKSALIKDIGNLFWYIDQNEDEFYKFRDLDREYRDCIDNNFYKIYIRRKDLFEVVLSYAIACQTGKWHRKRLEWWHKKLNIDPEFFVKTGHQLLRQKQYVENFCNFDSVVDYETLTFDPKKDLLKVFNFDLTKLRRASTITNPCKEKIVKNYTELKEIYQTIGANNE